MLRFSKCFHWVHLQRQTDNRETSLQPSHLTKNNSLKANQDETPTHLKLSTELQQKKKKKKKPTLNTKTARAVKSVAPNPPVNKLHRYQCKVSFSHLQWIKCQVLYVTVESPKEEEHRASKNTLKPPPHTHSQMMRMRMMMM